MIRGILFFENGEFQIIGQLRSVSDITAAIQKVMPDLIKQERDQILETVTNDELKQIIEARTKETKEDAD